jgi:hypothetical protein
MAIDKKDSATHKSRDTVVVLYVAVLSLSSIL